MPNYYQHIRGLLTGEGLGIPRDRLEWAGYTEVLELYKRTPVGQRSEMVKAMSDIIQGEKDWGLVADTIHLAYALNITQLMDAIRRFRSERLYSVDVEWKEAVNTQVDAFLKSV